MPPRSNRSTGEQRGVPQRFRAGHNAGRYRPKVAVLCGCGCGEMTNPGYRYVGHHHARMQPVVSIDSYAVEDHGYTTGCWIWQGAKNPAGYGRHRDGLAHRVMWQRTYGQIPKHLEPDHLCRQPDCINPAHIELVPPMVNKQRSRTAKLTAEQIVEIRADRRTQAHIARDYGISEHHVWVIRNRRAWVNVP